MEPGDAVVELKSDGQHTQQHSEVLNPRSARDPMTDAKLRESGLLISRKLRAGYARPPRRDMYASDPIHILPDTPHSLHLYYHRRRMLVLNHTPCGTPLPVGA